MDRFDSDTLSRQIIGLAPDAILFSDRDGIIRLWNKGAERIFGFTAEQAIGKSLDLIIPENLRDRHWEGYRKTMATGETGYGTMLLSVPALHQSGSRLSTEFSISLLVDENDEPLGVAAIMRDVTERFRKDRALKEQIAALKSARSNNQ